MRLIVAALFVVGSLFAAVALVSVSGVGERVPVVVGLALGLLLILLSIAALYLFNPWWANPLGLMKPEQVLQRLEDEGMLESADFQVRRAFGVREFDDEGLHYFLELADGRVLFLSGQYLYDYEPIEDDINEKELRRFPCTDFTIRRHKTEGYVVEIICRGTVLEPEFFAPPFPRQKGWLERIPEDGELISDTTYDALKASLGEDTELGAAADRGSKAGPGR
jgi:hypothetical protein